MNRKLGILVIISIFSLLAKPVPDDTNHVRIGLALSGGGALGLAHIGVLKVLEREGIPVSYLSTNSMGSIIGGLYAAGYKPAQIESITINIEWSTLFSPTLSFGTQYLSERQKSHRYVFRLTHRNFFPSVPSGLISLQKIEFLLIKLLSKIEYNTFYNFDSLVIPFRVIAVDLVTGCKVVLKQGSLEQAIRGSIAIPGVFAPQILADKKLVDGGVLQYFPVDPLLELQPDFIIAVLTTQYDDEQGISMIDVISRTTTLVGFEDIKRQKQLADVVIEPNLEQFQASDYSKVKELITAGEAAAIQALPEIRAKLAGRRPVTEHKEINDRALPGVHAVRFEGLQVTREATVQHKMRTKSGMELCFDRLYDDLVRLFNTGLFNNVNYRLEFIKEDSVDVVVEVQEQAYGFYLLGIRYDNEDNATIGFEVGQSNIKGSGVCVRAAINLGDPNEYRLGLTDTRLFALPFGYGIDGFWGSIDRAYYEDGNWLADYNTDYRGAVAEIGYSISHNAFFNAGFDGHQVVYRLPSLPAFDTLLSEEWIIGPTMNLEFNNFDDLYLPSKGLACRLNVLYSSSKLGATDEFLKIDFSADHLIPLSSWFVMHPGLDIGVSFDKLSWSTYFYTGGPNFIGFDKEEFTTKHKVVLRFGMNFKICDLFNQSTYPLYLQCFSNVASFKRIDKLIRSSKISSEDIHLGVGIGLKTNTPIGPLQIVGSIGDFHRQHQDENIRYSLVFSLGRDFRYTR
ncbi:BamA/TamA family outer membrane protein [candidate division WOR-3 bacterium]|nr:BamA/TamA family outer membrane protein [candidate division WOR-3 bacterium]